MGGFFSTTSVSNSNSALIISSTGELQPYSTPVFVSDVIQTESETEGFFVCNSDKLCYDEHITPLDAIDELHAGQIYFVLPVSKLRNRLSASEMAALAVKASVALNSNSNYKSKGRKSSGSKITPFVIGVIVDEEAQSKHDKQRALRVSRSGSIRRKMQYGRRTKLSFRLRLSTIYETDQSSHSHKHYS
ncbi:hypothetical protein E3N88_11747 [Mikania micrantha]|uniref:Uncharacterized protein n=1 Tax=Mikania micrantha TaxID=192012 RepID=A0A5N6P4Z5_9ASTR|nr:hypothetical protein E3N88_11747 [Mikania micrantha]